MGWSGEPDACCIFLATLEGNLYLCLGDSTFGETIGSIIFGISTLGETIGSFTLLFTLSCFLSSAFLFFPSRILSARSFFLCLPNSVRLPLSSTNPFFLSFANLVSFLFFVISSLSFFSSSVSFGLFLLMN